MASVKTITLIGAHGNLGQVLLTALLSSPKQFQVQVLQRDSSTSPPPSQGVTTIRIPDRFPVEDLTAALTSQDAVIVCFPLADLSTHLRIAEAAYAAGVKRFIPADFGSVDSRSEYARQLVKLFDKKVRVQELLESLSAKGVQEGKEWGWTSLVTGHLYDWGLRNGFLHLWPDEKRAEILGDGERKSSLSTLRRVGEAVVKILEAKEGDYRENMKGRVLMIQSFCVSQNEVLTMLERVTEETWEMRHEDTEGFIKRHKELVDAGNQESIENLVFALGVADGNWEEKGDFAMGLLGLADEDLETETRRALGSA